MAMVGQDVEQVQQLSNQLKQKANEIEQIANQLSNQLNNVQWIGQDATQFRNAWTSTHVPALRNVVNELNNAGATAQRNAQSQTETSNTL
ncbi:WXG100 family type VII secretion target [Pseudoclavibacter helvolus]|uniref:WXG100 family type VII secretion target n=1 Tax=Pseudoclavibacter helvolus TaxID=255205 RepID=UPI0024ADAECA|nr:WXG100 family type VII secretion target [Pseudoclavibacter helvolus]